LDFFKSIVENSESCQDEFQASKIIADPFSPIMVTGAAVFAFGGRGIMDPSITRKFEIPITLSGKHKGNYQNTEKFCMKMYLNFESTTADLSCGP
jgi:hypothetical protein